MKKLLSALALAAIATTSQATTDVYTQSTLYTCGGMSLGCSNIPVTPTADASLSINANGVLFVDVAGASGTATLNTTSVAIPGTYRQVITPISRSLYSNVVYYIDGVAGITGIVNASEKGPWCGSYLHKSYGQQCAVKYLKNSTFTVTQ